MGGYKLIYSLIITAEPYKRYSCLGCDNQGRRDWSITANLHVCEQSIELFFGMLEQHRVDWSGLGLHDCWHALNKIDMEGFTLIPSQLCGTKTLAPFVRSSSMILVFLANSGLTCDSNTFRYAFKDFTCPISMNDKNSGNELLAEYSHSSSGAVSR
jgi:hypothetical protein